MFGIEIPSLVRFFMQSGAAIAGASALWCLMFAFKARRNPTPKKEHFYALMHLLMPLFGVSLLVFLIGWWAAALIFFPPDIMAHEGVVGKPVYEYIKNGFNFNLVWVLLIIFVGLAGIQTYIRKKELFQKYAAPFFLSQFVFLSLILLFSAFTKSFDKEQMVFFLHNWHSIITLGTVVAVDFLYLCTLRKDSLKRTLYPLFPLMSAFIFVGLGMEFLSSLLVFNKALIITPQFLFNQTVIAIIIVNGVFLAGRINRILINLIKPDKVLTLDGSLKKLLRISASVSLVSWVTVTFIDFFEIPLVYYQFFIIYLLFIGAAYAVKPLLERPLRVL
ncbi:hypothetical protein MYX07_05010 [Patescibacteria group bacterium AH-259-L07]|nr:hypothetical protein [Patescibacteria group bacterium AH-259-L07]